MTDSRDRWPRLALAVLVAQIPFELRYSLFGLSNLQWTFLAAAAICTPLLLRNWKNLRSDRLVQTAGLFVATQWLAAAIAPEFQANAFKAAIRISAGFMLLAIIRSLNDRRVLSRVWIVAAGSAAIYSLSAYAGFGLPWLFRSGEFYIGQIQRLSGSFEYPNIAAAYFGMSLPVIWWSSFRAVWKWTFALLLWAAITLTFSKGALIAVPLAALAALIWPRPGSTGWRTAAGLVGLGVAAYIVLLPVTPYLSERVYGPAERNPLGAAYSTPWNLLQQQPHADDTVPLQIRNTGIAKWRSQGLWRTAVSYRWWRADTQTFLKGETPIVTMLPHDVGRGETVDLQAAIRTPAEPGEYILLVELFSRDFDWFSQTGLYPAMLRAEIRKEGRRATGQADMSRFYNWEKTRKAQAGKPAGDALTASVPRASLWRAALRMFADHPLGVGPDNYRLLYGKYLGASSWNTQIYSNNLYLELLTGSGILGLGAFALLILTIAWRAEAACLAVAVSLIHGLVDVFLMTTPIYFAFWIMAGLTQKRETVAAPDPATSSPALSK